MGVTFRGRNLSSLHPSWAVAGGGVGIFSRFSARGLLADLVIVTCTQAWFPGVLGVEPFNGDSGIFEVFCCAPGLVIFWGVSGPFGLVLKFVSVKARVHDFFEFVLGSSF